MSEQTTFPYPVAEYGAEDYWAACNEGRLVMQRCGKCQLFRWHPAPLCTHCGHDSYSWAELSGRGVITTWTVVTHPVHPAAVALVPYVVVEVELEEQVGLRMLSNLVEVDVDSIEMDAAVRVTFVKHANGQSLPVFKLA